jgi:hypothetical protein
VLVAADDAVYVLVVVSQDSARASERALRAAHVRCQLERDVPRCRSLDDALARAEAVKRAWIARGWLEDSDDHE